MLGKWWKIALLSLIGFLPGSSNSQSYVFAQLGGAPINTNGWNLQGSAAVGNILNTNNSEIIVCPASNNTSGAVFFNQPINLSICNKWKAEFDFRMFDGNGADGLAFCFLDVPPAGFVTGGGLGIPSSANGLKICFDTYNNCVSPSTTRIPKVEIRWGVGYSECWSQPTLENTSGEISYIRSNDYNRALIEYDNGNISVSVNGKLLLTGNQSFNFTGYLGFTASTGGLRDNHSIKNVIVYTDMPPSFAGGVNGMASGCAQQSIQLGTAPNTAYNYTWTPSTGINNATIANPVLELPNNSDTVQTLQYFVRTAFQSNPGCYSSDSITIQVNPKPKINFGKPAICLQDALAQFTDSSYTKDPASLPFSYQWHFDDPAATIANPNTSTLQNPSHIYSAAQVYQIKNKVTSAAGCEDSLTLPFTVNGAIPRAGMQISSARNYCNNENLYLLDQSSVNFGSTTRVDIFWDVATNPTIAETDMSPVIGKNYTHHYPTFTDTSGRNVTIRYEIYSGISCKNVISQSFSLVANPEVVFSPVAPMCSNYPAYQFIEASEITGIAGTGIFSGTGVTTSGLFTPFTAGQFLIQYTYVSTRGCLETATQVIIVKAAPAVSAGADQLILEGKSIPLPASVSGNGLQFQWSPMLYLNNDTLLQPICTPFQNIAYTLLASDSNGCVSTDTIFIKVLLKPIAPNAFSPNGDGIHDTWQILHLNDYPNGRILIYTRAGQLIYQSVGFATPWDGTYKGQPLPIGTYYYIIQPGNGSEVIKGSITLLR
jgi:gliding motility-associated-like protein